MLKSVCTIIGTGLLCFGDAAVGGRKMEWKRNERLLSSSPHPSVAAVQGGRMGISFAPEVQPGDPQWLASAVITSCGYRLRTVTLSRCPSVCTAALAQSCPDARLSERSLQDLKIPSWQLSDPVLCFSLWQPQLAQVRGFSPVTGTWRASYMISGHCKMKMQGPSPNMRRYSKRAAAER